MEALRGDSAANAVSRVWILMSETARNVADAGNTFSLLDSIMADSIMATLSLLKNYFQPK